MLALCLFGALGCGDELVLCSESELLADMTFLTADPVFLPEEIAAGDPLSLLVRLKGGFATPGLFGIVNAESGGPSGDLFSWSGGPDDTRAEIPINTDGLEAGEYLLVQLQSGGQELALGGMFAAYVENGSTTYEFAYRVNVDRVELCDSGVTVARFTVTP